MLAERLRLARKRAGLSLRELAEQLDRQVSAQAISKYESGAMMPSAGVLVALGQALDVSLDFLMSSQVAELCGVEFRKHSGTTAADRARVEAAVTDQVERYLAIEAILELESEAHALADHVKETVRDLDRAEELANQLRRRWDLGSDPIPSLTALFEEKGFKVVAVDLPDRVSGLTCDVHRPGGQSPISVIVANERHNVERWRFTLAHELAHRIIGGAAHGLRVEKAMDRFAAAFLVPAAHLKQESGESRHAMAYREIVRLKQLYGVSAAMLLLRLKHVGVLSEESVAYAFQTFARAWRTKEPEPLGPAIRKLERPERFERLVYRALAEGLIALPKAATLLRKPTSEIERELKGPVVGDADHRE